MNNKVWFYSWIAAALLLFLYSFTQVDLGLTLTRASFFKDIQQAFQYIGYFNRPLSTILFISLLVLFSALYLWTLRLVHHKKLSRKNIWRVILCASAILTLSYNAFSYDIFNYIFDAKIVTIYHQNPYEHKALDYPGDPMLGFMHWTHRTYPYGPGWLGITVPLSYLGLGYFLLTFFIFKALMTAAFLGTVYYIEKIAHKINPSHALFAVVFFAYNPLVIFESLVSSHNDIVMLFFSTWALYLFLEKKVAFSFLALFASISTKFVTVFLLPVFILKLFIKKMKEETFFHLLLLSMIMPILVASARTTFQPWYFLYFLAAAVFLSHKYYVLIPSVVLSSLFLLEYAVFLYTGEFTQQTESIIGTLDITAVALSIALTIFYYFFRKQKSI